MVYDRKQITELYWPVLFDLISAALMGLLDTMMVSSCGEATVSGVSLINQLCALIQVTITSFAVGGGAIVAQYFGRGDRERSCESAKQLIYLMLAVSGAVILLCELFRMPLITLFFGSAEQDVIKAGSDYYIYAVASMIPLSIFMGCSNSFRAFGMSSGYLVAALVANALNVVGNAFFIYVMEWGAAGAALSTLIARIVLVVIVVASITSKKHEMRVKDLFRFRPDFDILKRMSALALPHSSEAFLQQLGKTIAYSMMAALPTWQVAAYSVAASLGIWVEYIPAAMTNTMVAVVGKCCGAREKDEASRHGWLAILNSHISILPVALVFIVFGRPLVGLFGMSPEVSRLAVKMIAVYSIVCLAAYPETWTISAMIRPAGDVKFTMVVSILFMWICRVGGCWLFVNVFGWGIWGIWCGLYADWLLRCCFFIPRYLSGKWKKFEVI